MHTHTVKFFKKYEQYIVSYHIDTQTHIGTTILSNNNNSWFPAFHSHFQIEFLNY